MIDFLEIIPRHKKVKGGGRELIHALEQNNIFLMALETYIEANAFQMRSKKAQSGLRDEAKKIKSVIEANKNSIKGNLKVLR